MSRFTISTTKDGKCDVTLTFFNEENTIVGQKSHTYWKKPTIKELLEYSKLFKSYGATSVRITSSPSMCCKTYKLR